MALTISLVALSIDTMLPALPDIARDLKVGDANNAQLIITSLFLGLAAGQIFYGPVSDSIGRKPAIYAGYALFVAGTLLCLWTTDFSVMLAGRVLQGLGAAGPRIVANALIRDLYEGRGMARIMSYIMSIFIMVPAAAPLIGQGIITLAHWRAIFGLFLVMAIVTLLWFAVRQSETLAKDKRVPFSLKRIARGIIEVCRHPVAAGYTLVAGLVFGALIGFLVSIQQVFQDIYGKPDQFAGYFAVLACCIGAASLLNGRLVMRFGMQRLSNYALRSFTVLSAGMLAIVLAHDGIAPFWQFMTGFGVMFFCLGIVFGNLNALAMEPMGHMAGLASAVIGSITTFCSMVLGGLIGYAYDKTEIPLMAGYTTYGIAALLVVWRVQQRALREQPG